MLLQNAAILRASLSALNDAGASGLSPLNRYRSPERGARIARREERAYWA